jgi:hypothetical protein
MPPPTKAGLDVDLDALVKVAVLELDTRDVPAVTAGIAW